MYLAIDRCARPPRSRRGAKLFFATLLATTALTGASRAVASDQWLGVTVDWNLFSNWSTGNVPTSSDQVVIDLGSGFVAARILGGTAASQSIDIGLTSTTTSGLQVTNGAVLTSGGNANIGTNAGARGGVLVDGTGTSWALGSHNLNIGFSGNGSLTVSNGGSVSDFNGTIGYQAGGSGTVSVNSGGTWNSGGNLTIGNDGTGTLSVSGGSQVSTSTVNGNVFVGFGTTGSGTVTLDASSLLTRTADIGAAGVGTLTIQNGSGAFSTTGFVGDGAGSSGTVNVTGTNSRWTDSFSLVIGNSGHGVVNVSNGGQLTGNVITIGAQSGNTAANTLSVDSGTVQVNVALEVGDQGTGNLVVSNGGVINGAPGSSLAIGAQAGSSGRAIISGATSTVGTPLLVVGEFGTGVLQVSGGATVAATSLILAQNAGSVGRLVIGGSGAASAPGTVTVPLGIGMGAGTGEIDFNHTSSNYTFAAAVSGAGTIKQLAGVTDLTGNSSGFTGTTIISGGTLSVNGTLGGSITVNGGMLGGNGTIGALTVASGGRVAPGNSIGTLNVASISLHAGSTYIVQLDNGGNAAGVDNDLINATGTATISGGVVHVTPVNGTDDGSTYTPNTTYRIVTAAGGVTGAFSGVTDDFPFLNFTLSYDGNDVYLTSAIPPAVTTFCLAGMTSNECHTGAAAFSLGSGSLFNAVANLPAAAVPGALDQLSGEIYASARTVLVDDSRFARDAALNRLRSAFDGVDAGHIELAEKKVNDRDFTLWSQAFGSWGDWDGGENSGRLDRSVAGFLMGGDGLVSQDMRLGIFAGYSNASLDDSDHRSSGTAQTVTLGTYGGAQWGPFGLRFGGAYGWNHLSTDRDISFGSFSDSPSASYNARLAQLFGETGYRITAGSVNVEPFANLAYVNLASDGFKEHGGAAALKVTGRTTNTVFTTFGLRSEYRVLLAGMPVDLRGMVGWRHAFADISPDSTQAFASGGNAFTVTGVPVARNALVLDTGFNLELTPGATLGLAYDGQFAAGFTDQDVKANIAVHF